MDLRRQGEHTICRLLKSIYDLKQAFDNWFDKFTSTLLSAGFVQSKAGYSLFTYQRGGPITIILVDGAVTMAARGVEERDEADADVLSWKRNVEER